MNLQEGTQAVLLPGKDFLVVIHITSCVNNLGCGMGNILLFVYSLGATLPPAPAWEPPKEKAEEVCHIVPLLLHLP